MSNYSRCETCGAARATREFRTESGPVDVCDDCVYAAWVRAVAEVQGAYLLPTWTVRP